MAKVTGTSGNLKTGFKKVEARLQKELLKIKGGTVKGLLVACAEIRRDMEVTPPLIPVDDGNLRASFYIVNTAMSTSLTKFNVDGGNFKTGLPQVIGRLKAEHKPTINDAELEAKAKWGEEGVAMGFTAYYAAAVHEMGASGPTAGKTINWSRPGSGNKFFQSALYRNIPTVVHFVQQFAKVKP